MKNLIPIGFIAFAIFMFFSGTYFLNQEEKKWYDKGIIGSSYALSLIFIIIGITSWGKKD